jgi:hypothetical protein
MSEPSKEAMALAMELHIYDEDYSTAVNNDRKREIASIIDREFAALRARAEAASGLASALVAIKTEHANYTSVHGSDEDDEQAVALADSSLAAYEQAKEVKA